MQREMLIDGLRFHDYDGFVAEFNRGYVPLFGEPAWTGEIGDLDDFFAPVEESGGRLTVRWANSGKSAIDLGHDAMAEFWRRSLDGIPSGVFSPEGYQLVRGWNQEALDRAMAGLGRTLFEYLVWQIQGDGELVDVRLE